MPVLGLGTFGIARDQCYDIIRSAIRLGYRHFDCAPIYGNQKEIGKAINGAIDEGEVTREELWITSKLWNDQHRYNDVEPACEQTLEELGLEYLDLYMIHWPVAYERGIRFPENEEQWLDWGEAPLEDTWTGMEDCQDAGLAKHIGLCNFNMYALGLILDDCMMKPEVLQCEWHPYLPQQTLYDYCRSNKILMTAYAPLGAPGRPANLKNAGEPSLLDDLTIRQIAEKYQCTPAQVLLAYGMKRKMAVIPKTSNTDRLKENLAAVDIDLDREDLRELLVLPKHRYYKGESFLRNGSPYTNNDLWDY